MNNLAETTNVELPDSPDQSLGASSAASGPISFVKLPLEVQHRIWTYSLPSKRIVGVWFEEYDEAGYWATNISPPAILHVSVSARAFGLKHYQLDIGCGYSTQWSNATGRNERVYDPSSSRIYINWDTDTLCFMNNVTGLHRSVQAVEDLLQRCINMKLRSVAFAIDPELVILGDDGRHTHRDIISKILWENITNATGPVNRVANPHLEEVVLFEGEEDRLIQELERGVLKAAIKLENRELTYQEPETEYTRKDGHYFSHNNNLETYLKTVLENGPQNFYDTGDRSYRLRTDIVLPTWVAGAKLAEIQLYRYGWLCAKTWGGEARARDRESQACRGEFDGCYANCDPDRPFEAHHYARGYYQSSDDEGDEDDGDDGDEEHDDLEDDDEDQDEENDSEDDGEDHDNDE